MRKRRGYWVQRARERQNMTQRTLAQLMGYSGAKPESAVSRWESGLRPIPSDKLAPLAECLALPTSYLVNPPLTDEERLDRAVREASAIEREDWAAGDDSDPEDDDGPTFALGRRSA